MVVSNPPYIPAEDVPGLQREVALHEPHLALSGGPGGLEVVSGLVAQATDRIEAGGAILLEIGFDQGHRVHSLGEAFGLEVRVLDDLAGIPRCAVMTRSRTRSTPGR
jgi:release factor glutamine methyltransferase